MREFTRKHLSPTHLREAALATTLMVVASAPAQVSTPSALPTGAPIEHTFTLSSQGVKVGSPLITKVGGFSPQTPQTICAEAPPLENFTQVPNFVSVPGFTIGEEVGAILDIPAAQYPIEILRVRIGWASAAGGQPNSLEDSIRIYPGALPNPGAAQYSIAGPVLADGAINEFDLTTAAGGVGSRIINAGPFLVSLRIANAETPTSPAPIHDGNGCQPAKNAIFAQGLGWVDACLLGVSGDWAISVTYRQVNCTPFTDCNGNGIDDAQEIANNPALDCDLNGAIDSCQIAANPALDANGNGILDSCETPVACTSDLTMDGVVSAADLATLLANWGVCP